MKILMIIQRKKKVIIQHQYLMILLKQDIFLIHQNLVIYLKILQKIERNLKMSVLMKIVIKVKTNGVMIGM